MSRKPPTKRRPRPIAVRIAEATAPLDWGRGVAKTADTLQGVPAGRPAPVRVEVKIFS